MSPVTPLTQTTTVCRLHAKDDLRIEELPAEPLTPGSASVAIARGGICGSDLHYYRHGGFGPIRIKEPIILGHEISGVIEQLGKQDCDLKVGDKVAVSPSQPCLSCHFCHREEFQHCQTMRFLGSARTVPHVQGGFRTRLVIPVEQCFKIGPDTSLASAACAEPLAVCLHAAKQAGDLRGQRVLVTGAGPIGALCVAIAKEQGAETIVATDLSDFTLDNARQMGATQTINVATQVDMIEQFKTPSQFFDVVFECSAAEAAIAMAIDCVRPRGTIIQVGVAGNLNLPINAIVGKEIAFKGTHRFHHEFAEAVRLIDKRQIDVDPMITRTFPLHDAHQAFACALDRTSAVKVQLSFNT